MGSALNNQTVLITGAARGIGLAIAQCFATEGAKLAICDVDSQGAQEAAMALNGMGVEAQAFVLDVRDPLQWDTTVSDVEATLGPIAVLVNNAGIMPVGALLEIEQAVDERQVAININGVIYGTRAVLGGMLERGQGHIVSLASLAGRIPTPYAAVYAATKFAVVGFSESLRLEHLGSGVGFTVVHPGFVSTELIKGIETPTWPKPARPEEVASAVVRAVKRKASRVYVPWYGGVLSVLPWLLPDWLVIGLARLTNSLGLMSRVDPAERASYRSRALKERDRAP